MSNHTPEPWFSDSEHVGSSVSDRFNDGWFAAKCLGPDRVENARRIVTCVNACAGMEYPAAEIDELKRQRDELLGLVKAVVYHSVSVTVNGTRYAAFPWVEYEEMVNKAKGGEK